MAIYWLVVAGMVLGVIGSFLPGLPGMTLMLGCVLVWGFFKGFAGLGLTVGVIFGIWVLSFGIDFFATFWGMKKAGASKWGQIGALVGMIAGFLGLLPTIPIGGPLGPLLGLMLGPLLGAVVGEYLYRRDLKIALKAALGVLVSTIFGNVIQGCLAIASLILFLVTTWPFTADSFATLSHSITHPAWPWHFPMEQWEWIKLKALEKNDMNPPEAIATIIAQGKNTLSSTCLCFGASSKELGIIFECSKRVILG